MTTTSSVSNSSLLSTYLASQAAAQSTSSSSSTSSSDSSSLTSITGNLSTFLKILTTQLSNQDPTDATNTDQFTQELVEFAGVEQQINTNTKLENILTEIKSNGITPLLSYVGKTVQVSDDSQVLVQDGSAKFSYTLTDAATSVKMTIKNSSGNTVTTLTGTGQEGSNLVTWDGTDSRGNQVDDGLYTLTITAKNSSGDSLTASDISLIGVVTGIETSGTTTTLSVGDANVSASDITAVYAGTTTVSTSSTTASSSTSS
jgi:flagellar basal-body rod modification protein FlgD